MDNRVNPNFLYLLFTISHLVSEYLITFRTLFGHTITLFFQVINTQVSAYFTVFNNLFIASLDTLRFLVNGHFKLVNKLMVKNKTQNIIVLASTVIILHLNHFVLPVIIESYYHHYLNQSHPVPISNYRASPNSQCPYSHHQLLLLN